MPRHYDPESELYYYRTRYLDPNAGRFTTRDSIGIWGDPSNLGNGYTYVGNNPQTFVDPWGHFGSAPGVPLPQQKLPPEAEEYITGAIEPLTELPAQCENVCKAAYNDFPGFILNFPFAAIEGVKDSVTGIPGTINDAVSGDPKKMGKAHVTIICTVAGGFGAYKGIKELLESLGHRKVKNTDDLKFRTKPIDLEEHLALEEAKSGLGKPIQDIVINDPKYQKHDKMEWVHEHPDGSNTVIHYWRNRTTGENSGFKFKDEPGSRNNPRVIPPIPHTPKNDLAPINEKGLKSWK